jgi:hypothetical protein
VYFARRRIHAPTFASVEQFTVPSDADVDLEGHVVIAAQAEGGIDIHFIRAHVVHRVMEPMRYPGIRWIDRSRVLLFDRRSDKGIENALIVDESGRTCLRFAIGDAVSDVICTETCLVVMYFDEGVFGDDPLSNSGVAIFDHDGRYLWGWNNTMSAAKPQVVDCYAGVAADSNTVGILMYTSFNGAHYVFATLDLDRRAFAVYDVPQALHKTHAVAATAGGTWLFVTGPRGQNRVVTWRPGDVEYGSVEVPFPLSRGLSGGRFIGVTEDSIDIATALVGGQGSGPNGRGRH